MLADLVIIGFLILAFLFGWKKGTIVVLANIGSIVIGYQVARAVSAIIAEKITASISMIEPESLSSGFISILSLLIDTNAVANRLVEIIVFIIIFIIVNWVIRALANILTGLFGGSILGKINRAIGALLALLLGAAIVIIAVEIILPTIVELGFGKEVLSFMQGSEYLLPYLYSLEALL